jgi:hypothetical protein
LRVGCFDTVHDGERVEQVKLWGNGLRLLHVGDRVGSPRGGLAPEGTYSVAMRSGGSVHVLDGVITGWDDEAAPEPLLTTGGGVFDPADYPGGDFGPWYRFAEMPRRLRWDGDPEPCPRCSGAPVRLVSERLVERDRRATAARKTVEAEIGAGLDEAGRIGMARRWLDAGESAPVTYEAIAALLDIERDPLAAGPRLVRLLEELPAEDSVWISAAGVVGSAARFLHAAGVRKCLRLLADALPERDRSRRRAEPDDQEMHPAIARRRRALLPAPSGVRVMRYSDMIFRDAAEDAVAVQGAGVLPAIPLRFWAQDIAAHPLIEKLLLPIAGRPFTDEEADALKFALSKLGGYLAELNPYQLLAAIDDGVQFHRGRCE